MNQILNQPTYQVFSRIKPLPKQHVEPIRVLVVNLVLRADIIKQHLPKTFSHPEVGKMIIAETPTQKRIQDLTIASWIVIEEEQLTKVNLGTNENVGQVKVNASHESIIIKQPIELLKEFKYIFAQTYKRPERYSTKNCSTQN